MWDIEKNFASLHSTNPFEPARDVFISTVYFNCAQVSLFLHINFCNKQTAPPVDSYHSLGTTGVTTNNRMAGFNTSTLQWLPLTRQLQIQTHPEEQGTQLTVTLHNPALVTEMNAMLVCTGSMRACTAPSNSFTWIIFPTLKVLVFSEHNPQTVADNLWA